MESNTPSISLGSIRTSKSKIWHTCSCSWKMWFCGWTFIKTIHKNYFIFSSWKQWKPLQSWSYCEKSEPWRWGRTPSTCKLHFTGDAKYIDKLKYILPALSWTYIFNFIFSHFLIIKEYIEYIFALGTKKIFQIS